MNNTAQELSRRGFIRVAGGSTAALLLAACGGAAAPASTPASTPASGSPASTAAGGSAAASVAKPAASGSAAASASGAAAAKTGNSVFPTYVAIPSGSKPDFPSDGPQYEDGFTFYPKVNPKTWNKAAPGTGSNVVVFTQARGVGGTVTPTPHDQNQAWQEVEKQLNAKVSYQIVPTADYQTKLSAIMSGGDLPDVIFFQGGLGGGNATSGTGGASLSTNLPLFLQNQMADLTPYLSGDAAKDYPNLAAIPTFAWKNSGCAFNGHLYMWPVERYRPLNMMFKNTDMWDKAVGANYTPKSADDFKRVLTALNQPKSGIYAINGTNTQYNLQVFPAMFHAPNNWAIDASGKLVKDIEAPEYKEAIGFLRDLVASGLFVPDSIGTSQSSVVPFVQGKAATVTYTFGVNWSTLWLQIQSAKTNVKFLPLNLFPGHEGAKGGHFMGPGFIGTNGMKKASPDRIKELLRIMDWLAAPFGSQEDMLLSYGIKDVDHTVNADGLPVLTSRGTADTSSVPWLYIVQHPQVMFYPGYQEYAKLEHDAEHELIPAGIEDPTWGLFSATQASKGPAANQGVLDTLTGIIVGRQPLTDYDQMVKDWQSAAGNQMRTELQQAIQAAA